MQSDEGCTAVGCTDCHSQHHQGYQSSFNTREVSFALVVYYYKRVSWYNFLAQKWIFYLPKNQYCSNAPPQQVWITSLVKHCMYTSVCRFMEVGWPVLNVWLAEAKKTQDVAVLVEVMQVNCTSM